MNNTHENMNNSEVLHKVPEGLLSTDVGRRENMGVEEFTRGPRNEATSHSLLGHLSGTDHKIKGRTTKDNATMSINTKKYNMPHGYEQSLSNMIKYDTTAVISEEYSNYDDPFTHLYTNSILSGWKPDRNIEEMHYLQVSLFKSIRKVLEKSEQDKDQKKPEGEKPRKDESDANNLLEIWSDTSL